MNGAGLAVETTASFPSPAQDYFSGPAHLALDRHLVRRPVSTYVLRVASDALASMGIRVGDEILVDRALRPALGRVLVFVHEGEHRLARCEAVGGGPVLVTDEEEILIDPEHGIEAWGVVTVLIHHLPLGPAWEPPDYAGGGRGPTVG